MANATREEKFCLFRDIVAKNAASYVNIHIGGVEYNPHYERKYYEEYKKLYDFILSRWENEIQDT
jgi:hypothetical protein